MMNSTNSIGPKVPQRWRDGVLAGCLALACSWTPAEAQGRRPSDTGGALADLQTQIDENTMAIGILEGKTTLFDLPCTTNEIARFDGTAWVCAPNPETQVAELTHALCTKADQDGDTIRPLVCEPRCDCFAPQLAQGVVTSCSESAPGDYTAALVETRQAVCAGSACENSSRERCSCETCRSDFGFLISCNCSACPDGEFCRPFPFTLTAGTCVQPCNETSDCPVAGFEVELDLSGVGEVGGADVAHCECTGSDCEPRDMNSNDAHACLAAIEATFGDVCTSLP